MKLISHDGLKILLLVVCFFSFGQIAYSQAASYTDPAVATSRILLEKGANGAGFSRVGTFKVSGSPYLFGTGELGNIYTTSGNMENVTLRYNTFSGQLETDEKTGNEKSSIDIDNVDSFTLKHTKIHEDLSFIRTSLVDSSKKDFLLSIYAGKKYSLFKMYKSELGISSTNYGQSDLRQFDLGYEYYYTSPDFYGIKKLKTSEPALKKAFNSKTDVNAYCRQNDRKTGLQNFLAGFFRQLDM